MARGNQRDKAREKNLKEQAGKVCLSLIFAATNNGYLCRYTSEEQIADFTNRKARTLYVYPRETGYSSLEGSWLTTGCSNPVPNSRAPRRM